MNILLIKPSNTHTHTHTSLSLSSGEKRGSHSPAIIRIGSDGKPAFSKKKSPKPRQPNKESPPATHTLQTSPARRVSSTASGSSSPDSLSSGGQGAKFSFEGAQRLSPRSSGGQSSGGQGVEGRRGFKHTSSDSTVGMRREKDLSDVNR